VIHSTRRFTEMEATDTSTNHKLTEDYRGEGGGGKDDDDEEEEVLMLM